MQSWFSWADSSLAILLILVGLYCATLRGFFPPAHFFFPFLLCWFVRFFATQCRGNEEATNRILMSANKLWNLWPVGSSFVLLIFLHFLRCCFSLSVWRLWTLFVCCLPSLSSFKTIPAPESFVKLVQSSPWVSLSFYPSVSLSHHRLFFCCCCGC
jgi:hypothetical protein